MCSKKEREKEKRRNTTARNAKSDKSSINTGRTQAAVVVEHKEDLEQAKK